MKRSPSSSALGQTSRQYPPVDNIADVDDTRPSPVLHVPLMKRSPSLSALGQTSRQYPPGFGNVANVDDTSPSPVHELVMKRSPSLSALGQTSRQYPPGFGNAADVDDRSQESLMKRNPSLSALGQTSRQCPLGFGNAANGDDTSPSPEQLRTIPEGSDDEVLGGQASSMRRSPSSGIFTDCSISKKSPADENFRGFSVGSMLFAQHPEQPRTNPEITTDGAELESICMEPQKLHAFDHKPSPCLASSFITEEPAVYLPGGAQVLGFDTPQGPSFDSKDATKLFAQVLQKRLELLELEDAFLSLPFESSLMQNLSIPRASDYCSMPIPANTHQHKTCQNVCRYYALGKCIKGDACSFLHLQNNTRTGGDPLIIHNPASRTQNPRMYGRQMGWTDANHLHCGLDTETITMNNHHIPLVNDSRTSPEFMATSSLQNLNYRQGIIKNLDDLQGHMCTAAKDPQLCRILQAKLGQGNTKDVEKVFEELMKADLVELTMDPCANYLIKKLVEVCSSAQYKSMFQAFLKRDSLVTMSLNAHGTRVVQKVIERMETHTDERCSMIFSLHRDVVRLSKDPWGNHVVQKCVQHLRHGNCFQLMYDAITSHCEEIASDQHGCLVLQRCLDFGSTSQAKQLIDAINANAVSLVQHPFGNYVVQHIFNLNLAWASKAVIFKLKGKFAELAVQKYSSNVVEKCLKVADEEDQAGIVKELMEPSVFNMLLDHPFANYVIQSALAVTQGSLHTSLVQAILPRVSEIRNSTYGKRILSCSYLYSQLSARK